jgi:transcriptional regulator with XRE-family HTH domain
LQKCSAYANTRSVASKVASRIERARVERKWDYRALSDALGVSLSTAYNWANGNHEPNLKSLRRISKKLGISIAELVA